MNTGKTAATTWLVLSQGLYPHLGLEENQRELERQRELQRTIREARREARERRRASRTGLRSRVRQLLRPSPSTEKESQEMQGVIVEFQYGEEFEAARLAAIAREARERFVALPGLRQKAFTVEEANHRATNVYLWESEEPARRFFDAELLEQIASLYGVRPTVSFVEIAELIENA